MIACFPKLVLTASSWHRGQELTLKDLCHRLSWVSREAFYPGSYTSAYKKDHSGDKRYFSFSLGGKRYELPYECCADYALSDFWKAIHQAFDNNNIPYRAYTLPPDPESGHFSMRYMVLTREQYLYFRDKLPLTPLW
jgi:hypothetical protein